MPKQKIGPGPSNHDLLEAIDGMRMDIRDLARRVDDIRRLSRLIDMLTGELRKLQSDE